MKRVKIVLATTLIAAAVMTGCGDKKNSTGTAKENKTTKTEKNAVIEKKNSIFGNWDSAAELKKIQGTLTVKDQFGSIGSTWIVKGKEVTVIRKNDTTEATLDLSIPCQLKVVETLTGGGTSTSTFGYARNGDDIYIGLGTTGMKVDDLYLIAKGGIVVYDGKEAKFYGEKRFGEKGFEEPIKVNAKINESVLSFEVPDRYKKGELREYNVEIIGTALLNEQAKGNLVQK